MNQLTLFAQSAPNVDAMTIPMLLASVIAAWYVVKHLGCKVVHGLVWMTVGVLGATGIPGQVTGAILAVVVQVVTGIDLG
jgi:hypothetical protein